MGDCVQTWRKKLKLQELLWIANQALDKGVDTSSVYKILDNEMKTRWRFVNTTRKLYIKDIKKILSNQYSLVI